MLKIDVTHKLVPADKWKKINFEDHFLVKLPSLSLTSKFLTLGSCFAQHIVKGLQKAGVAVNEDSDFISYEDLITTTQAMVEQFEWSCNQDSSAIPPIYFMGPKLEKDRKTRSLLPTDEEWAEAKNDSNNPEVLKKMHEVCHDSVKKADCIILTLGLSEVWYDKKTGNSVWQWPGKDKAKHLSFKVLTAEENSQNLHKIISLIRSNNQNCSIVISLSPIPLRATFRTDNNIFISNCSSKARLRAGIDQFFVENLDKNVYYWPTYEFLTHPPSSDRFWEEDERHVKYEIIYKIVETFIKKIGI